MKRLPAKNCLRYFAGFCFVWLMSWAFGVACASGLLPAYPNFGVPSSGADKSDEHDLIVEKLEKIAPSSIARDRLPGIARGFLRIFNGQLPDRINSLQEGNTTQSQAFNFKLKNRAYVLRMSNLQLESYEHREREIEALSIAARHKIVPAIHYANTADGIYILDYIARHPVASELPLPQETLELIAKTLRTVHRMPLFRWDYSIFDAIYRMEKELSLFYPTLTRGAFAYVKGIEPVLREAGQDLQRMVSSHNHLIPDHMIFDRSNLFLIDWEDCGNNYPFVDLATVALFYDVGNERDFLRLYLGYEPSEREFAFYYCIKQLVTVYHGFYFLKQKLPENKHFYNEQEIEQLPNLHDYLHTLDEGRPMFFVPKQQYRMGLIMIKEMIKNVRSETFQNTIDLLKKN
jgi:thiamine kinase-like enzyme